MPQELQLEEPQLAQELPPTGIGTPLSLFEKQAKVDNIRSAVCLQLGHDAGSLARLNGRNSSNLALHSGQKYSYIGISLSYNLSLYSI